MENFGRKDVQKYEILDKVFEYYGSKCARCGLVLKESSDFVVCHRNSVDVEFNVVDSDIGNLIVLCRSCYSRFYNELDRFSKKFVGLSMVEEGVRYILLGLKEEYGLDLSDENFRDTPKRIARAYAEIFEGVRNTEEQVKEILNSAFPSEYAGIVVAKDIRAFSLCPHHLLPVDYVVSVAYIPSVDGNVLGVSKLSRLVELLSRRPVLQEQLSEDITKALMSLKGCVGAACIVRGKHYCLIMRGVKQRDSEIVTSSVKGAFLDDPVTRSELMALWK